MVLDLSGRKKELQEEASEIRAGGGLSLSGGIGKREDVQKEPSLLQRIVAIGSQSVAGRGGKEIKEIKKSSEDVFKQFGKRTQENVREVTGNLLEGLSQERLKPTLPEPKKEGFFTKIFRRTVSPLIPGTDTADTLKRFGLLDEFLISAKAGVGLVEAPISAAISPAIEAGIKKFELEDEAQTFGSALEFTTKEFGGKVNKGLNLDLSEAGEEALGELSFIAGGIGAGTGISFGAKSALRRFTKVDADADITRKEQSVQNIAKTVIDEGKIVDEPKFRQVVSDISESTEVNIQDISRKLDGFGFAQQSNFLLNKLKRDTIAGTTKPVRNDKVEINKIEKSVLKELDNRKFKEADIETKTTIINDISKKLNVKKDGVKAIVAQTVDISSDDIVNKSISNIPKFKGTNDDIVDVVNLLDNDVVKKTDVDGNYEFKFTKEGVERLVKSAIFSQAEINNLKTKGLQIDKARFDEQFSKTSIEVPTAKERNAEVVRILKEFQTSDRDYNRLILSIAEFETGKRATTESDIIASLNNLNTKYQLGLQKKIDDVVDVVTGEIDRTKLKILTKEIAEIKKNEFLNGSKLLKQEPTTLKQKLGIEEKLFNKLYKTGFKDATIKQKKIAKDRIALLRKQQKDKISKISEKNKEKRALIKERFDDKIKQERLRTKDAAEFRKVLITSLRELSKSEEFYGDMNKIIAQITSTKKLQEAKTPKQINKILEDLHEKLLVENTRGLHKEIQKELKDFARPAGLKARGRKKFNASQYEMLRGYKYMYEQASLGDANMADLQDFLNYIKDLKETARVNLKKKRIARAKSAAEEIKIIKEEGINDLKGDVVQSSYTGNSNSRIVAAARRYNNELNYMYRVLEQIGGGLDTQFYKTFWLDTDMAYNEYLDFKNFKIDTVIEKVDGLFKKETQRRDAGSYLTSLRIKFINNKDGSVSPDYEGLNAMFGDKNSALNTKRNTKAQDVMPEGLPFTDSIWDEIKTTKLGEILERHNTPEFKKLNEMTRELFDELGDDVGRVAEEFDNIPLHRVSNYIPLSTKSGTIEADLGGFGEVTYGNHIKNNFLKKTTGGKEIEYEYDVAKLIQRGANNEAYYAHVKPHYERLKDIYQGRKVPKDSVKDFDADEMQRLGIREEIDVQTGEVTYRQGDGLRKDMGETTRKSMQVFFERLANNGDKFDTIGSFINKSTAYVNNQILGFNPSTTAKQLLSLLDGGGIVGYKNLTWASGKSLSAKVRKDAIKASATLRNRFGGELSMSELDKSLSGAGTAGKTFAKFQKIGMLPVKFFDQQVALRIWLGAYRKYLIDNKMIGEIDDVIKFDVPDAISFADDLMQRSVSTVNPLALPTGYRSAYVRIVGQLMSTQLNRIGIISRDMPNMVKRGEYRRAAITTISYMVSSFGDKAITAAVGKIGFDLGLATWDGYDKEFAEILFGEDTDENLQKLGEYVMSEFVGGRAITSLFKGDDMTVLGGYLKRIARDVQQTATAEDGEEAMEKALKTIADSFGMYPGRALYNYYSNQ